ALVTENTTDEISSSQSQSIACAIRMNTAPTIASGVVSNHKRCEFGVSSGTSGYKGITTGTTQINDISFMIASVNSRVTDNDAISRADGNWHTIVGVYNYDTAVAANNTAKIYIDGNLIATVTLDPANPSIGNAAAYPEDSMLAKRLLIGALLTANGGLSTAYNFFTGDIANIAIFNQALSAQACVDYHNYVFDYV
ncbi:LamG-like jellyroll fold domain-containing protein, partial [Acinetobacter higginsii]|uniref:LamG-like jellyroll fold domain-containing protein n=1 Tax=Acinetobacter higginsii TaxID=70347 RepID=UPI003008097F